MMLGRERFIRDVLGRLEDGVFEREEVSHRRALAGTVDAESMLERVSRYCRCERSELAGGGDGAARKVAVYILKTCTSLSNSEIGELLGGIGYSGVSKCYSRFSEELQADKELGRALKGLVAEMSNVKG